MRVLTALTDIVLVIALSTSCASVQQSADAPTLDGTAWVLTELPGRSLPAGQPATLAFQGGRAVGSDGCNRFSTAYTARGSSLEIASGASTLMACPPDRRELAQAVAGALSAAKGYRIADGKLRLIGGDGAVLATFARQLEDLAGTSWTATSINNGKGGVASVVQGAIVTLQFEAGGRASGSAGCNSFGGGYTADGSSLRFQPMATTRKMCAVPGVMEQEAAYLNALGTVATARVEGDRLELRTAAGALAASFTRAVGR